MQYLLFKKNRVSRNRGLNRNAGTKNIIKIQKIWC